MSDTIFSAITGSPLAGCLSDVEVDRTGGTGSARLCCPPDFAGFDGHFPGEPVLPAVMQLLAVRLLAETVLGIPLLPVDVDRLKFKGMVRPNEKVALKVSLSTEGSSVRASFSLKRAEGGVASGTVNFKSAPEA